MKPATAKLATTVKEKNLMKAIKEYRESLLEEFLLYKEQLKEELEQFCKTGTKVWGKTICIHLDDVAPVQDCKAEHAIRKQMVERFLTCFLSEMNKEGMNWFKDFMAAGEDWREINWFSPFLKMSNIIEIDEKVKQLETTLMENDEI